MRGVPRLSYDGDPGLETVLREAGLPINWEAVIVLVKVKKRMVYCVYETM